MPGQKRCILLADDHDSIREVVVSSLAKAGVYQIVTAVDGGAAIETFESDPDRFDLVITDYSMPVRNGKDVALAVRALRPRTPIIVLSAHLPRDLPVFPEGCMVVPKIELDSLLDAVAAIFAGLAAR